MCKYKLSDKTLNVSCTVHCCDNQVNEELMILFDFDSEFIICPFCQNSIDI